MNVLILTDLEGISGVDTMEHITDMTEGDGKLYRYACERLMADTNAAIEGAVRAGAETIYVIDGHGPGTNFIDELLDERATKVPASSFTELVNDEKLDAYLQVGAHAKPGTLNGFLDHVQNSKTWHNYKVNGVCYGEIVQGSLFVGSKNIPCVMVSGDEAACEEAKECLGSQIACAVVKRGVGRNKAECMELSLAEELIRNAAEDGIRRRNEMKPFTLPMPITIQVEFNRTDYCEERIRPDLRRVDARTLEKTVYEIHKYQDVLL